MEKTKAWQLYESGKKWNNQLKPNYYDMYDTNWAFFNGDQWRNVDVENMPKPVFNLIRRTVTFLVASLTSTKSKIRLEPLEGLNGLDPFHDSNIANTQVSNLLEKLKFDTKLKDALFDAAITGDGACHIYFDLNKKPYGDAVTLSNGQVVTNIVGEICMELVDGTNIYFGNANSTDVQSQPYVIVSGRDLVSRLREEKKLYKQLSSNEEEVMNDSAYGDSSGQSDNAGDMGKIEIDADEFGKAQYIILYRKKKMPKTSVNSAGRKEITEVETVWASKSTQKGYIYEEIDTGLSKYPVAWFNWEKKKGSYHGVSQCGSIMPNQIFINRMWSLVMYHLLMTAFPKAVYNADFVPEWNNEIGAAIPIYGTDLGTNIKNVAGYLEPGNMSNQIMQVLDLAMQHTKEMLGINDTSLGNVRPDNTSAIIAVQKSAAIPLENPKTNMYQWIEDIGEILLDMMGTKYGVRPLPIDITVPKIDPMTGLPAVDPMTGQPQEETQKQIISYDFSRLKDMWLNVQADVGESSYWSEVATEQTLTNLLSQGLIDVIQFLERTPNDRVPEKDKLIQELQIRQQQMQMQAQMQMQMDQQAQEEQPNNKKPGKGGD